MSSPVQPSSRVVVDGKFFRIGGQRFHPKGVTYGPFKRAADGHGFGTVEEATRDFRIIRGLGANLLRVYEVPPRWFLDLAETHGLKLLVDIPWNKRNCFLEDTEAQRLARDTVRAAAQACAAHPAVFALSVVNEIPADIVRWSGAREMGDFIDDLIRVVREVDPEMPCTFGNFPPTEYLQPRSVDFFCFNVYLHDRRALANYLARLQQLAGSKPLILGECGIDTVREGEAAQAEILGWTIETAFRSGLAGLVIYSFTDEWWYEGVRILDWALGLTTAARELKPAYQTVRRQFGVAPHFPLPRAPRVSVVIASFNGAPTLPACLDSLLLLNYPDYEVIVVDDGSTDDTQVILRGYPSVRAVKHPVNLGLSAARNSGIERASGEIVAFTDSDCRVDEDWLYFLVGDLLSTNHVGIGGHNLLPPDDSCTAAAVMVSPGGPAHVMLDDRRAEHLPGCNMAFYKWALDSIGGFDPVYRKAGDDVDVCWRLQQHGLRLGFSHGGFVWHYRRNTVGSYFKQQAGYGEAEAMLEQRHPENFNELGASRWRGRIYTPAKLGIEMRPQIIYHGRFGTALFQSIYAPAPNLTLVTVTSIEYHALVTLPLLVLGSIFPLAGQLGLVSLAFTISMCAAAAWQAELPRDRTRWWSRPLVAWLFFAQPLVRGWARHHRKWASPRPASSTSWAPSLELAATPSHELCVRRFLTETGMDRHELLRHIMQGLQDDGWHYRTDAGWNQFDLEIFGTPWARLLVTTAGEQDYSRGAVLRCRLDARWTFVARVSLFASSGMVVLIIALLGRGWAWCLAALLPMLWLFIHIQGTHLQRRFAHLLERVARAAGLIPIPGAQH